MRVSNSRKIILFIFLTLKTKNYVNRTIRWGN
jgi:hypothetical protein